MGYHSDRDQEYYTDAPKKITNALEAAGLVVDYVQPEGYSIFSDEWFHQRYHAEGGGEYIVIKAKVLVKVTVEKQDIKREEA